MATGEYGNLIKEEVKSALEEHISKEKCDAPEIISKMKFELENIKSEDVVDVVYDMKSEKCVEEGKRGLQCEVCGGLLCTTDFFSPDSLESICNCQNESNDRQDEDMTWDFKPFNIGADSRNFHFEIKEETLVGKEEEVDNENVPSTSYENEISVESFHVVNHKTLIKTEEVDETFRSGYDLKSVGQRIQEDNKMGSKNLNEQTDSKNFHFEIQEETLVGKKKEEETENVPSTSCENKISIERFHVVKHETLQKTEDDETFRSGYDLSSVEQRFQEENEMCSKNLNESTSIGNRPIKKIFNCKVCTRSFSQSCDLRRHERIHTGEKPFQCKLCSKFFTRKDSLTAHEKIHTGETPFQCKICLKSFIQRCNLKSHEKIHTGEKPFQCKMCFKFFTRKNTLTSHEKIHTRKKSFQCKICSKSFIQRSNWKSHEKIHTDEKPFQCKTCSNSYIPPSHLKLHEKIHTGEKPFQCEMCSKSFI
nr:zinc finger protein 260-like isoform X1 [Leptinotarsa decemlineata]